MFATLQRAHPTQPPHKVRLPRILPSQSRPELRQRATRRAKQLLSVISWYHSHNSGPVESSSMTFLPVTRLVMWPIKRKANRTTSKKHPIGTRAALIQVGQATRPEIASPLIQ